MSSYIHSKRGGSHIIDLTKTVDHLEKALNFIYETAASGKQILLVSTKQQAQVAIKATAEATNMPYVTERWLGGMMTNSNTINGRIKHLKDLEEKMSSGELANRYSKLEVQRFQEEIEAMNHMYGGIKEMHAKVGAVFVIDIVNDINAVKEARKLGIPVVALVDTNADPSLITYPIACNDDATKAITLIMLHVQKAIEAGKAKQKVAAPVDETDTPKKAVKTEESESEEELVELNIPEVDKKLEEKLEKQVEKVDQEITAKKVASKATKKDKADKEDK